MNGDQAGTAAATPFVDGEALEKRLKSSASWFYWIAGLSLVNTAIAFSGEDSAFLLGLATTQIVDYVAKLAVEDGGPAAIHWIAVGFDVFVAGIFIAAGAFARRRPWIYVTGIVLYALDAVLCLLLQIWPSLAFHALALFFLVTGFLALRQLRRAEAPAAASPAPANPLVR
jgi:hypothetical protein